MITWRGGHRGLISSEASSSWPVTTCCMRCIHLDDWTPYALLTMCGMSYLTHIEASSSSLQHKKKRKQRLTFWNFCRSLINTLQSGPERMNKRFWYLSGTRGAKQDVVEWTQSTFSAPSSSILRSTAPRSVRSSSPSTTFSTTTGSKPEQTARWERETAGDSGALSRVLLTRQACRMFRVHHKSLCVRNCASVWTPVKPVSRMWGWGDRQEAECHLTCCDHGFEAGLLVNAGPNDVAGLGAAVAEGQETQRQAHPCCHGNDKAASHAADTC